MLATEWGVGQALWSMFWFFVFVLWIWLVISIFADILRSHDLGGFAKAAWLFGIIFFPYLGIFIYLIARGGSMAQRNLESAQARDEAFRAYVRDAANSPAPKA